MSHLTIFRISHSYKIPGSNLASLDLPALSLSKMYTSSMLGAVKSEMQWFMKEAVSLSYKSMLMMTMITTTTDTKHDCLGLITQNSTPRLRSNLASLFWERTLWVRSRLVPTIIRMLLREKRRRLWDEKDICGGFDGVRNEFAKAHSKQAYLGLYSSLAR
jgi:hypothetical protein